MGNLHAADFSGMLARKPMNDDSPTKNAAAQALTALRNQKLTPEKRSELARRAALARWSKKYKVTRRAA